MRIKTDLVIVAAVALGGYLLYRQIAGGAAAAGHAVTAGASWTWNTMQSPVVDMAVPGASTLNGIVAAPSNALNTTSFGTIGGTGNGSLGLLDTLKAGPFGGLVGQLSGDGNTNIFGPAPSAGIDLGNPATGW